MKKIASCLTAAIAAPLCCLVVYIAIYETFAGLMIDAMPIGQDRARDWMMGTPQPVFGGESESFSGDPGSLPAGLSTFSNFYNVWDGEQVPRAGYATDLNFRCGMIVEGGHISGSRFGELCKGGSCKNHSGQDFSAGCTHARVQTPISGMVTYAGLDGYEGQRDWNDMTCSGMADPLRAGYFGRFVAIENGDIQLIFGHLHEIYVGVGDMVSAGQVIGTTGSAGNSAGIHLHFELRVWDSEHERWRPVDPRSFNWPGYGVCSMNSPMEWLDSGDQGGQS